MWTAVGYWNPFLRLTFKFFRHINYLSSCKAPFTCSKGSNISGLSKPLASCFFVFFFKLFFFSLLLFVRFQHMLTMLYDLGLGSLPTGHDDIPDNTGATGASRSLPANPPNGMCVLKIWHASQGLRCSRGTEGLCLDRFLTRLHQNNRPLNSFFLEKYSTDPVCCSDNSEVLEGWAGGTTQLAHNMMQKPTLCFYSAVLI